MKFQTGTQKVTIDEPIYTRPSDLYNKDRIVVAVEKQKVVIKAFRIAEKDEKYLTYPSGAFVNPGPSVGPVFVVEPFPPPPEQLPEGWWE